MLIDIQRGKNMKKTIVVLVCMGLLFSTVSFCKTLKCEVVEIMTSDIATSITSNLEEDMMLIRCSDTEAITKLQPGQKIKVKLEKKKVIEGC
jgi:hypothetical protein